LRRLIVFEPERWVNERRDGDFGWCVPRCGAEGFALLRSKAALPVAIG
jgi:hypothetical protein